MFHLDAIEESPIAFIHSSIDVFELAKSMELMFGDLGLLLFGLFLDDLLLDLFLWSHDFYNLSLFCV